MAGCIENLVDSLPDWSKFTSNLTEQIQEIEVLKSYYENTDILEVIEEASQTENKKFSLQLRIPIETKQTPIKVEIWLPIEQVDFNSIKELNQIESKKPQLIRSISGKQAHTVINCKKLIPIQIDVVLPDVYPSDSKPIFTIGAEWLNKAQLSQLSVKLNQIWEENETMPILFTWCQWITENLVDFLDIFEPPNMIIVTPLNNGEFDLGQDISIQSLFLSADNFIVNLLRYNYIEEMKEFQNSLQNCMVCFDEKMGREFIRLDICKHHYCEACMRSMCEMHVREGTIQLLKCPDTECNELVSIDIMSQVLNSQDFERWERLLFQRTLDAMEDIVYCPRCTNPIIVDNNDSHAYCLICNIDYCKICKDIWHSGICSTEEEKINQRVQNLQVTVQDLMKMSEEEIRRRFKDSDYVIRLQKKSNETENQEAIKSFLSKCVRCPNCRIPIEKIEGCNKVTCRCGCILCYVCGQKISGYDHFQNNTKCLLWTYQPTPGPRVVEQPRHEVQIQVERVLNIMPEQRRNVINCVTCGQRNLKLARNNHIKCWLCKTNFCFECRKKIVGNFSAHFSTVSKCKQHSD